MSGINLIDISITGICNYKCDYCYGEDCDFEMSFNRFKKVLEFCKSMEIKTLEFCGGEPLTHREFAKFVNCSKEQGFNLILRTNGILIKNYSSLISKNFDWVGISLDGTKKYNDLMRNSSLSAKDKFEIPLRNICLLKKLNPSLKILLASVSSKKNYKNLSKLAKFLMTKKIPVDLWKIYQFLDDKHRAVENKRKFNLSDDKFNKLKHKKIFNRFNKVIFKDSKENKDSCLIVRPSGEIYVGNKKISNLNLKKTPQIKKDLINSMNSTLIQNKKETYYT